MRNYILNLYKYRDLFIELIKKDIKLKYHNSFLGILWSMLNPMLMTVVLSVVFMALFRNEIQYFPLYVMIGRIIYQYFSEATNFAMNSIIDNKALIRKVYLPKYFFPLSRVGSSFITMLPALIPLALLMIVMGIPFRWINLMVVVPLFYLVVISGGIGLFLASINVFFRDMKHLYSIILMILMYMTPIFYPASIIPEQYRFFIELNPLFDIVEMFRSITMDGVFPGFSMHIIPIAYMFIFGVTGLWIFYKSQHRFIHHF